jgi:hypothetical protein
MQTIKSPKLKLKKPGAKGLTGRFKGHTRKLRRVFTIGAPANNQMSWGLVNRMNRAKSAKRKQVRYSYYSIDYGLVI